MSIFEPLPGKIGEILQRGRGRFEKLEKAKQKNIILGGITLVLGTGLFFWTFLDSHAMAQDQVNGNETVALEVIDPLNKIGLGLEREKCKNPNSACDQEKAGKNSIDDVKNDNILQLVAGYPMEEMVDALNQQSSEVAAYLVAIAKKESDWGKHTPKKNGRECFNFWGYRGKENPTESGYSCFDSSEHAVRIVGERIEKLISQKINTPAKMVVWKCGGDCEAAGGQAAAIKWISDVTHIYSKLQS